uniref:Coiled-coil domain containing 185 n=1 Tax=Salvator merianae TaxID=96440 RepID=A0A8D0C7X9_SALMN
MRRHQQRRRPRRGSGQCLGGAEGSRGRVSPGDRVASGTSKGRRKPPAASSCSLSGAESQQEMARRRSPGRFSPPRGFIDAYSSEPEAAGGEGGLAHQKYRDEVGPPLLPRKSKGASQPRSKTAAASHPRRLSSRQQHQRLAPAGEGCATPCHQHGRHSPSPAGRMNRVEELLRDEQWACPVARPLDYGAADFPCSDASKPPSLADLMQSWTRQYEEDEPLTYPPQDHRQAHTRPATSPHKARKGDIAQINLQDLTDKRYEDLIPERDKKIAALMLARHQEEEEMKERQLQVLDAWDKMRRKEKKNKSKQEKERQYQLAESLDQWQKDRDQRKAKLRLEEQQLLAARERDMMLCDRKWKKIAKEQESRKREKLENARLQAEYKKRCQEKHLWDKRLTERNSKEQNSHLYKEKMLQALEKRLVKEMERKRRKADVDEYKKPKHMQVKDQEDDRLKADELYKRLCIEQKLQRSQEILEQLLEERNRELKDKSCKEEEQGLMANVRAKETEEEKRRRKEMLLQIAEMKIQQAREIMSKNIQDRAQRMKEINCTKERNHHCRKQKLDYEEKCHLRDMQEALRRKEQRSNQILKRKDMQETVVGLPDRSACLSHYNTACSYLEASQLPIHFPLWFFVCWTGLWNYNEMSW